MILKYEKERGMSMREDKVGLSNFFSDKNDSEEKKLNFRSQHFESEEFKIVSNFWKNMKECFGIIGLVAINNRLKGLVLTLPEFGENFARNLYSGKHVPTVEEIKEAQVIVKVLTEKDSKDCISDYFGGFAYDIQSGEFIDVFRDYDYPDGHLRVFRKNKLPEGFTLIKVEENGELCYPEEIAEWLTDDVKSDIKALV